MTLPAKPGTPIILRGRPAFDVFAHAAQRARCHLSEIEPIRGYGAETYRVHISRNTDHPHHEQRTSKP